MSLAPSVWTVPSARSVGAPLGRVLLGVVPGKEAAIPRLCSQIKQGEALVKAPTLLAPVSVPGAVGRCERHEVSVRTSGVWSQRKVTRLG